MLCACVRGAAVLRWIRVHRRHGGTRWARPGCTRPPNASFRLRTRPAATRSTAPTPWRCRSGLPFGPRSLQFQFRFLHILRWLTATCPPNTHTHTSCARVLSHFSFSHSLLHVARSLFLPLADASLLLCLSILFLSILLRRTLAELARPCLRMSSSGNDCAGAVCV